jgi:glycosyltransferase involved in cell wall biosynthesis
MRICIFTPTFLPTIGGVELAVHHIATELSHKGHEVVVLTFRGDGSDSGRSYRVCSMLPGLARFGGKMAFVKEDGIAASLALLYTRWRFDVLNVHMAYPGGIAASIFKRLFNVPTVLTCHAVDVQSHPELGYGMRLMPGMESRIRRGIERADVVTAVSESVAGDVKELCSGVGPVSVIPNGVAGSRFQLPNIDMREELGINATDRIILTVGRNHPKKGFANLAKAIGKLHERRGDVKCVIAGDGTQTLQTLIDMLDLRDVVLIPGRIPNAKGGKLDPSAIPHDQLVSLYMTSDVFTMPSYIEGLPLVIPEAMMAGLPVVATNVPGNRDIVVHGHNGILIPPGDVDALANSLENVLSDDAARARLSSGARATAESLDWSNIASSYESVYDSATSVVNKTLIA